MDSPNPTPIFQNLENVMNQVDFEHLAGETNDDQRQLAYIYDSEQLSPLNTILEPLINISSGKALSSSSSDLGSDLLLLLV